MYVPDRKKAASLIVADLDGDKPAGEMERSHQDDDLAQEDGELEAFAEDFVKALHSKDAKGLASAFKAMFIACEAQPHPEADDEDIEDFHGVGGPYGT